VHAAITDVGREIHAETAAKTLSDKLDRELAEAAARGTAAHDRPRVLIVVDRDPGGLGGLVIAGPGSFLDDLVTRAGGQNVVTSGDGYMRVSPDLVVERAPEVILDAIHTDDVNRATADWDVLPSVPAVRDHRVFVFGDRAVVTPGPRLGGVVKRIAEALHPTR
jgi:iron complex transport system substrate-binding protein